MHLGFQFINVNVNVKFEKIGGKSSVNLQQVLPFTNNKSM